MFPHGLLSELRDFIGGPNGAKFTSAKPYLDDLVRRSAGLDSDDHPLGEARLHLERLVGLVFDDITKMTDGWTDQLMDAATPVRLSAAMSPVMLSPAQSNSSEDGLDTDESAKANAAPGLGRIIVPDTGMESALPKKSPSLPPLHPLTPGTPANRSSNKFIEWYSAYKNLPMAVTIYVCVQGSLETTFVNDRAENKFDQLCEKAGPDLDHFDSHFGDDSTARDVRKRVIDSLSSDRAHVNIEPLSVTTWSCGVTQKKYMTLVFNIREPRTRERAALVFEEDISARLLDDGPAARKSMMSPSASRQNLERENDAGLSPIDKSLKLLKRVRDNGYLDSHSIQAINSVLRMLQTAPERLYDVDISEMVKVTGLKGKDRDVVNFIEGFTRQSPRRQTQSSMGQRRRHSVHTSMLFSNRQGSGTYPLQRTPTGAGAVFPLVSTMSRKCSTDDFPLLDGANLWEFDVFEFASVCSEPLVMMMDYCMKHYKLYNSLHISQRKFAEFSVALEQGYRGANPYHNKVHATDVLQTCFHFLQQPGMRQKLNLSDIELLAIIVAAAGHDVDHPGVSNNFLIATSDPLAIQYNDHSVLENMHCSKLFSKLFEPEKNFLAESNISKSDQLYFRKLIVSMILSTDMAQHFTLLGEFKHRLQSDINTTEEADRSLALRVLIKCADISNVAKPLPVYSQWTDRVMSEFFSQGDQEKKLKLAVSPFMDRSKDETARCQVSFISFICRPLFQCWDEFTEGNYVAQIDRNKQHWEAKMEAGSEGNSEEQRSESARSSGDHGSDHESDDANRNDPDTEC